MQLSVQITGSPSPDAGQFDFFDVTAGGLAGGRPDPRRGVGSAQLKWFEEEFFKTLSAAVPQRTRSRVP